MPTASRDVRSQKADIGQTALPIAMASAATVERRSPTSTLAATVHCVDDRIIEWLKRREQASFNCFGESAEITAALRRGPAR